MKEVIFDFDGTLFRGDSYRRFAWFAAGWPKFMWGVFVTSPWILGWKLGLCSNSMQKELLFTRWFGGWSEERFEQKGREFARIVGSRLFPDVFAALQRHQRLGHRITIASASYRQWIEPWAHALGIERVIATEPEIINHRLTGRYGEGGNCEGAEKVRRLRPLLTPGAKIVVYTDSQADRPLMDIADEVYFVGSSGSLRKM